MIGKKDSQNVFCLKERKEEKHYHSILISSEGEKERETRDHPRIRKKKELRLWPAVVKEGEDATLLHRPIPNQKGRKS